MSNSVRGTKRSAEDADAASDGAASTSPKPGDASVASSGAGAGPNAREARLRNNREKAKVRRDNKKALIEDMQRNVVVLSKMNSDLKKKNSLLLTQLSQYGSKGHPGDIEPVDVSWVRLNSFGALTWIDYFYVSCSNFTKIDAYI